MYSLNYSRTIIQPMLISQACGDDGRWAWHPDKFATWLFFLVDMCYTRDFRSAQGPSPYLNTVSVWVNTTRVGVGTISLVFCLTAHLRSVEVVQAPQTAGVLDSGVPLHLVSCFFHLPSFCNVSDQCNALNPCSESVYIHKHDGHA